MPYATPPARVLLPIVGRAPVLIIPPRELMGDELRIARLEAYIGARFPALTFAVSDDRRLAGKRPKVGVQARPDGRAVLSVPQDHALLDSVLEAVETFVAYGAHTH